MRILVLGGTSFVGRAIVSDALDQGDDVTLFSRGQTGPELFGGVERRRGDRDTGDYTSLVAGSWDAVVDVSGYVPRHVAQATQALRGSVGRYLFISTGSVYDRQQASDRISEDSARLQPVRDTEQITEHTYGPLKVACEDDVLSAWGAAATLVRPGIVAGPHDPSDRFTYWVRRAATGGRLAIPARLDQPVQVMDAGDLARLTVQLLHDDRPGVYNAVGPADPVTLAQLVLTCADAAGSSVELVPVDPSVVEPGFPLVLPDETWDVMFRRSRAAAEDAGLPATPLVRTSADVLAWDRQRDAPPLSVGLTPERERQLLAGA